MNSSRTTPSTPVHQIVRSCSVETHRDDDSGHQQSDGEIWDVWVPKNQLFPKVDRNESSTPIIGNALRVVEWEPSSTSK